MVSLFESTRKVVPISFLASSATTPCFVQEFSSFEWPLRLSRHRQYQGRNQYSNTTNRARSFRLSGKNGLRHRRHELLPPCAPPRRQRQPCGGTYLRLPWKPDK